MKDAVARADSRWQMARVLTLFFLRVLCVLGGEIFSSAYKKHSLAASCLNTCLVANCVHFMHPPIQAHSDKSIA